MTQPMKVNGADLFAADLAEAAVQVRAGNDAIIRATGAELLSFIRDRAPEDTGEYRSSWRSDTKPSADGVSVHVYTEAVQAGRLEYGMHGRDSRGRMYDVAPASHQRAGNDSVYPQVYAALRALTERVVS